VTGRLQRADGVTHVIAEKIEDISPLLDQLLAPVEKKIGNRVAGT